MGSTVCLECPKCGYAFRAVMYGRSLNGEEVDRILEMRKKDSEIINVYKHMKKKRIFSKINVYTCNKCVDYYNYENLILEGEDGTYHESRGVCPKCKKSDGVKIDNERFLMMPGEKSKMICPKCLENLVVTGGGILD